MSFAKYLEQICQLQEALLTYIDDQEQNDENFAILCSHLEKIKSDKSELKLFLNLLSTITDSHHRNSNFFTRIEKIFRFLENDIKKNYSNSELFDLFKGNKKIILFFIEAKFIDTDDSQLKRVIEQNKIEPNYIYYFYPNLQTEPDENHDEKRKIGENHSYICSLIRQDSIDEFVSYVNRANFNLSSNIEPSIFETNSFLIEKKQKMVNESLKSDNINQFNFDFNFSINKNPTLIEYAAFFGSIQIFNYLRMNNVNLTPSLWLYAIHGKNAEIIHILEENHINPIDKTYVKCFKESIKCHHNDIANYIQNQYLSDQYSNIGTISKYYNFSIFQNLQNLQINDDLFFFLCENNYFSLVKILLQEANIDINRVMIKVYRFYIIQRHQFISNSKNDF